MKKLQFIIFQFFLFLSCDNSIDVNAEYDSIPIVYGLLNSNAEEHYIRIQRSYLPEKESALVIAQNADSIYFAHIDQLYVEERVGDAHIAFFPLEKIDGDSLELGKEAGLFNNSVNYLYRFRTNLNTNHQYYFSMIADKDTVSANTPIIGEIKQFIPLNQEVSINFNTPYSFYWRIAKNAKAYQLNLNIYITEQNLETDEIQIKKLVWNIFNNKKLPNQSTIQVLEYVIQQEVFYRFLSNQLTIDNNLERKLSSIVFNLSAVSESIYLMEQHERASNGISSLYMINNYTNIKNGRGLFGAYNNVKINSIYLSRNALDSLYCGRFTKDLNFTGPFKDCY